MIHLCWRQQLQNRVTHLLVAAPLTVWFVLAFGISMAGCVDSAALVPATASSLGTRMTSPPPTTTLPMITSPVPNDNSPLVSVEIIGLRCLDNEPCSVSMTVNRNGLVSSFDGLVATQRDYGPEWVKSLEAELKDLPTPTREECSVGEPRHVYNVPRPSHPESTFSICSGDIEKSKAFVRLEAARRSLHLN
jgi:hypothetical protein